MSIGSYFVLSATAATMNLLYAWQMHEQFYPIVVHLATDKVSLAVLYNFAFSCFIMLGYALLKFFIGRKSEFFMICGIERGRGRICEFLFCSRILQNHLSFGDVRNGGAICGYRRILPARSGRCCRSKLSSPKKEPSTVHNQNFEGLALHLGRTHRRGAPRTSLHGRLSCSGHPLQLHLVEFWRIHRRVR